MRTVTASTFSASKADQFSALESTVTTSSELSGELLDQYMDTGLDLEINAGASGMTRLQESWLRRLYTTLRDTGLDPRRHETSRALCFDALYQVFFALRHIYRSRPGGECSLRKLSREMQFISHHLV